MDSTTLIKAVLALKVSSLAKLVVFHLLTVEETSLADTVLCLRRRTADVSVGLAELSSLNLITGDSRSFKLNQETFEFNVKSRRHPLAEKLLPQKSKGIEKLGVLTVLNYFYELRQKHVAPQGRRNSSQDFLLMRHLLKSFGPQKTYDAVTHFFDSGAYKLRMPVSVYNFQKHLKPKAKVSTAA